AVIKAFLRSIGFAFIWTPFRVAHLGLWRLGSIVFNLKKSPARLPSEGESPMQLGDSQKNEKESDGGRDLKRISGLLKCLASSPDS
ncbi:MAG: hypothetical protein ACKN81_21150, partial [Pirellulaceae bacterium]